MAAVTPRRLTSPHPVGEGERKRTVLWVSTSLATRGGISSYVRSMSATELFSEWNIRHVTTHRDGSPLVKMVQFLVSVPLFVWYLIRDDPALVHLHVASNGSFFRKFTLSVIARGFGIPVIAHIHGGGFGQFYSDAPKLVQRAIRELLRNSGAVIALGTLWAERLRAIEPNADVTVIPNIARTRDPVVQPVDGEPVEVLFLGRVNEEKGTFALLGAWHQMLAEGRLHRSAHLTIAGDGDVERARLTVADLGIATSVDVTGWLSAESVQDVLRRSHILVLPSHVEGQPMSILEAMANGLCVIASPVGGVPDLLGGTGILVPPGNVTALAEALQENVSDDDARIRLGAAALARVRNLFDADVIWRRFDHLYEEVGRW